MNQGDATPTTRTTAATVAINGHAARMIRILTGPGQSQFARQIKVSQSYLARIESGERTRVSPEVFNAILAGLNITDRRVLLANPHADAGQVAA